MAVCVQGNSGREDVLFLRLHLLQSLLSYIEGDDTQARLQLDKVKRDRFLVLALTSVSLIADKRVMEATSRQC